MFERHFKLTENPFSLTPDPRFIYPGRSHEEALATLRYWVEHREGFVMVTGEVGTGKTTALFRLIDSLEQRFEIAFITNSTLNTVELLEEVCRRFKIEGISPGLTKSALLQRLEGYLVKLRELRHAAILIIDEAQNFNSELLEEVRLLSNTVVPSGPPLLQIALVGQPELERKLSREDLRQLRQRIGVHYRIEPLSEDETIRYIRHRIGVAGGNPDVVFRPDAARQLYRYTRGLPREINQVASQSMLHAFVDGAQSVTAEHVKSAAWEMQFRSVLDRGEIPTAPAGADTAPAVTPLPVNVNPRPPVAPGTGAAGPGPVEAGVTVPASPPPPVGAVPSEPAPSEPAPSEPAPSEMASSEPAPPESAPREPAPPVAPPTAGPLEPTPAKPVSPGPIQPVPPLKTVPPLELPAARSRAGADVAGGAPRITRVSRLGPLPETGARSGDAGGSTWKRVGLVGLAVALLVAVGWLLLMQKPRPPEVPSGGVTQTPAGADSSGPAGQRRQEALAESRSAERADSTIMRGSTTLPHTGSAAADSARKSLGEMQRAAAAAPEVPRDTVVTPPPVASPPPAASPAVDPSAAPRAGGGLSDAWRLQVASFRDSALAYREGHRLAQRMNWEYEVVRGRLRDEGAIYAVYVGPFGSKVDADSAAQQISTLKLGFKDALTKPPRTRR